MSTTSYTTWATFDVEEALKLVDETEKRELQEKQQQMQLQAKKKLESSVTHVAQRSADIFAAQAAVAALKAKKKTRRGRYVKEENCVETEIQKAAKLQTQAKFVALKHELLQEIMKNRRLGDVIVTGKNENWHEAKGYYEIALDATVKLEEIVPALLQVEEEQAQLLAVTLKEEDTKFSVCGQEKKGCGHSDQGQTKRCDDKQVSKKSDEILPKANDLVAIITMFYKDVYIGIGTCDFEEENFASAAEAFKEVLLRDEGHLATWLKRGEAFEKMNAPLLAMLHYNRITNLDAEHDVGKKALERVKTKLLVEGDTDTGEYRKIKNATSACMEGRTCKEVLERVQLAFEEACVLHVESFFHYSTTRFQGVLGCLEALRARPEIQNQDSLPPVLRDLEISCHLNIASGCLEIQRNYALGLIHCQQVLRLDNKCVTAYFHMGQLYHALHKYKKALECYEIARGMFPAMVAGQTDERHETILSTIVKATDKCEFDRNQYDMEYLRSLEAQKFVNA